MWDTTPAPPYLPTVLEGGFGLFSHRHSEPERRPGTFGTLGANATSHKLCQTFAYWQSQSGATIFTGRRTVSLSKRFEYMFQLVRRNTYSTVADDKPKGNGVFIFAIFPDLERYDTFCGKFNGVADEVYDDLAESASVTSQCRWNFGIYC